MKTKWIATLMALAVLACKKDDGPADNNPNLIDPLVNINLNLNLPEYNPLKFPGNSVIIFQQGIKGVVVYNVNNELYTAFELSDPNHVPSSCSRMTVDGIIATCPCTTDSNEYDIVTGQHKTNQSLFPLQRYRAERTGDNVVVTN